MMYFSPITMILLIPLPPSMINYTLFYINTQPHPLFFKFNNNSLISLAHSSMQLYDASNPFLNIHTPKPPHRFPLLHTQTIDTSILIHKLSPGM
jgi:hypothetical protein